MKNLMMIVICSALMIGCADDLKVLDGIETPPEAIDDLTGLWMSDECKVTSDSEMYRKVIIVDEYGNITYGKRHYITDPLDMPSYRCEGGFTESTDSVDYIDSVTASPWLFSDDSSNEYAKAVNLNSGAVMAIDVSKIFPYGTPYGKDIMHLLEISGDCISADTCNDLDDRQISYQDGLEFSYRRVL